MDRSPKHIFRQLVFLVLMVMVAMFFGSLFLESFLSLHPSLVCSRVVLWNCANEASYVPRPESRHLNSTSRDRHISDGHVSVENSTANSEVVFKTNVTKYGDDVMGKTSGGKGRDDVIAKVKVGPAKGGNPAWSSGVAREKPKDLCPETPPVEETKVTLNLTEITYEELEHDLRPFLQLGGRHPGPSTCRSRERVALIIPYRDRQRNLHILLHNLVPFLVRQQTEFTIFLVEQASGMLFNKGVLIDVGFAQARKYGNFTCFIVHDTDLIPVDYRNLYRCGPQPRHLMLRRFNDHYSENLPYQSFLGGAMALTPEQFVKANGWSTAYYGWGFEDDDLEIRLRSHDMHVIRYPMDLGVYWKLDHPTAAHGPRGELTKTVKSRMNVEGLNSLNYTLVHQQNRTLYTWFLVEPPPPPPEIYGDLLKR